MAKRRHGIGQHPLVEYDWDDRTGRAVLTYRTRDVETGEETDVVESRDEPMRPGHRRWAELGQREMKCRSEIGMLGMIGDRVEAQIVGLDADYCWQYL